MKTPVLTHKDSKLCYEDQQAVAYALYDAGFEPEWSTNIADMLTVGYTCTDHGSFVYPLMLDRTEGENTIVPWHIVKEINKEIQRENDAPSFYKANLDALLFSDIVRFNSSIFEIVNVAGKIGFISTDQDYCLAIGKQSSATLEEWRHAQEYQNVVVKSLKDTLNKFNERFKG